MDNSLPRIVDVEEQQPPVLKLLCGADLLESFGTPGLWADEDVSLSPDCVKMDICICPAQNVLVDTGHQIVLIKF